MSAAESENMLARIHPGIGPLETVDARDAYAGLEFGSLARPSRPYVVVNMVSTLDGQARLGTDTSELGDAADAALFASLRERVDCVMAGPKTVAVEGYRAMARSEEVQQRRSAAGLRPRPIFATVTRSGQLDTSAPLYGDSGLDVRVYCGRPVDLSGVDARVVARQLTEPQEVLQDLRASDGVRSVLLEGGPGLNTPFFAAGLVDEIFLTLAPTLVGGEESFPILAGSLPSPQQLELLGVLQGNGHLYLRYRLR